MQRRRLFRALQFSRPVDAAELVDLALEEHMTPLDR
jgi:hypothetical protein